MRPLVELPLTEVEKVLGQNTELQSLKKTIVISKNSNKRTELIEELILKINQNNESKKAFDHCFEKLARVGIFIVPVGMLESWTPTAEPKVRLAEVAPEIIKNDPNLNSRFKGFMREVLGYLDIDLIS